MNLQRKQLIIIFLMGVIVVLTITTAYFAYVSYEQSIRIESLPVGVTTQASPLSYQDLYPVATTSTPFGGWIFYENTKHGYKIAYPRQLFIANGGRLPDQSTTREQQIYPSADEQWDVISIEWGNDGDPFIYLTIEAWGPDTMTAYGDDYTRIGSIALKPFVEKLDKTWAGHEDVPPYKIEEITLGGETAYKINEGSSSKIFVEHDKEKFIITFNNDPISEMIANSLEFTSK